MSDAPTPAEILADRKKHGGSADPDTTDTGLEEGYEFIAEWIDTKPPGTHHTTAKGLLVDIDHYNPSIGETTDDFSIQSVGRSFASMFRGNTPDGYLPGVSVDKWGTSKPTTWIIEVPDDE
jgi:hypothetical protein